MKTLIILLTLIFLTMSTKSQYYLDTGVYYSKTLKEWINKNPKHKDYVKILYQFGRNIKHITYHIKFSMVYIPKAPKRKAKPWGKNQKLYSSHRWRTARLHYLADNPICCKCDRTATVVDHIVPITNGGSVWDKKNWQPMCRHHHNSKSARESNK